MNYIPFNYDRINMAAGTYNPSPVKAVDNQSFAFWCRNLFQRMTSVFEWTLPEEWQGPRKDFFLWCIYQFGFVAISENDEYGKFFQPCTLSGYDFYYQPTQALISNPKMNARLDIGTECEILKLTPDYYGLFDIIEYYAGKLSTLDNAIDMSLINNKFAFMLFAKNKAAASAFEKALDKINSGEPAVITDIKLYNDSTDKMEPWQFWERPDLKKAYLTTDQLQDFQTLLNNFDAEIGIPTIPYQKKERMVQSEAESRQLDSRARSTRLFETLQGSISDVKKLYPDIVLDVAMRYDENTVEDQEVDNNE